MRYAVLSVLAASALATGAVRVASAGTVTVTAKYVDDNPTTIVQIHRPDGDSPLVYAGRSNFQTVSVVDAHGKVVYLPEFYDPQNNPKTFQGFCIDVRTWISPGQYTWELAELKDAYNLTTMTAPIVTDLKKLWYRHYGDTNTNENAAAFQLAVWDIIYGKGGTVDDSSQPFYVMSADTGTISTANRYLSDLGPVANNDVLALRSLTTQDFGVFVAGGLPTANPVPVPAAVWTGMSLLLGMGVMTVVRRRSEARG